MDPLVERPFLLYAALVLVTVLLPTVRARALAAAGLLLTALGIAADRVGTAVAGGGFATTNEILIGTGGVIVAVAAIRAWRHRSIAPENALEIVPRYPPDILLLAGLLFVGFGPHLILLAAGVFLALLSAAAIALRSHRARWLGLLAFGAALLGVGFFLLFTILGPAGGRIRELAAGPFSPPAERLLAILLGLGSLAIAGVFPFHLAPWRLSLAPVAAILLARVLVPALPEGVGDWQAPAMLWLAGAVAYSALSGRWAAAMVTAGLLGIWSGYAVGAVPGVVLTLFGWLADARLIPPRAPFLAPGERWAGVWFAVPAAYIPFLLAAALHAQVLVSVLALAAAVTGLLLKSRSPAGAD